MPGFGEQKVGKKKKFKQNSNKEIRGDHLYRIAVSHHAKGDLSNAEKKYREAIEVGFSNSSVFLNLGVICKTSGRIKEAIILYKKAIEVSPNKPEAYINLANLYQIICDFESAIAFSTKSLELKQNNPQALITLGWSHKELGNLDQALAATIKCIELQPDNPAAHMNLGVIYQDLGDQDRALASTLSSLELQPDNPAAYMNLGGIYKKIGNLDLALASNLKSLELQPDSPSAHMNLGGIYKDLGQQDLALASTLKSLKLQPGNHTCHMNLGIIQHELGNFDQAIASYRNALKIKPNYPLARWNLSQAMLLTGDYTNGWKQYEYRFESEEVSLPAVPSIERWEGDRLEQLKQLLVVSEQGIGDTLQFIRYAKLLKSKGIRIRVHAQTKLHGLIKSSGIEDSPINDKELSQITEGQWVPLLSIPGILKVCAERPITTEPSIKGEERIHSKWKKIFSNKRQPVIGINWKSNRKDIFRNSRDIPIELFAKIVNKADASFLSLQRDSHKSELDTIWSKQSQLDFQSEVSRIADSDDPDDFLEYASIVANCNLVITTDTTVAHLAANMGILTWILLPKTPNWRWGLRGEESFWYQSVKLFRQKVERDWTKEIAKIIKELDEHLKVNYNDKSNEI